VILDSIYLILINLSWYVGLKHIKNKLIIGKSNISPFEGMWDLKYLYYLPLLLFGFAIYTDGILSIILWSIYALVIMYSYYRLKLRLESKWRTIYYPLSIPYARFSGYEAGLSGLTRASNPVDFEPLIKIAVKNVLYSVYPDFNDVEINSIIQNIRNKHQTFSDKGELINYHTNIDSNYNKEANIVFQNRVQNDMRGAVFLPLYLYAEIIERDFGPKKRLKFKVAALSGKIA